jgi:hypothetical protein
MNPVVILVWAAVNAAAKIATLFLDRRKTDGEEQGAATPIPAAAPAVPTPTGRPGSRGQPATAAGVILHLERPKLMDYESLRLSGREYSEPGMYAWYFDEVSAAATHENCHRVDKWTLLYVGKASSLRYRLLRDHFGGDAEGSTLRLTLGCLLGIQLYVRGTNRERWWFGPQGEKQLSGWMREHGRVAVAKVRDGALGWPSQVGDLEGHILDRTERMLIDHFWLPLNLDHNREEVCGKVRAIRDACKKAALPYREEAQ